MRSGFSFILIHFFVLSTFAVAGVGGTGGGNISKTKYQLVTVKACDDGETGQECRIVRFYDRPKSPPLEPECFVYHGEASMLPCPTNYTKSNFIQDVIKFFVNQGFETKIMVQSL